MDWNEVGDKIAQIRKKHRLSLSEMGVLVGKKKADRKKISHVTIRNWENGSTIQKENWDALLAAITALDPELSEKIAGNSPHSTDEEMVYASKYQEIYALSSDSQKALMDEIQKMIEEGKLTDQIADAVRTILQSVQSNKKQTGLFKR